VGEDFEAEVVDAPAYGIHDGAKIVFCSPELADMFGYSSPDEMTSKPPLEFVDPRYHNQSIIEIMSDKDGGPYRSVGIRSDGLRFSIEVSGFPVRWEKAVARLILVRDVSPLALIVDDSAVIRNMMSLLVRQLGYRALVAESAESALRCFRPGAFALVITDIVMPHSSGAELMGRLRDSDGELPVLLMSGSTDHPLTLDENARFIRKPFGMEELSQAIGTLPERARAGLV
jgi:PAS domain S-box-containing protein